MAEVELLWELYRTPMVDVAFADIRRSGADITRDAMVVASVMCRGREVASLPLVRIDPEPTSDEMLRWW